MFPLHLLTVVLATLSLAYCDDDKNVPYPIFPKCSQEILNQIKTYQTISGTPERVFEKASKKGSYLATKTSYDYNSNATTCIYMKFAETGFNSTFVSNGVTEYVQRFTGEEKDGVFRARRAENDAPEYGVNLYPIIFKDDVFVFYACGNLEGSQKQPTTTILLTKEGANKTPANPGLNSMGSVLTQWGFNLNRNYGLECFKSGNEPKVPSSPTPSFPSIGGFNNIL